MKKFIALVLTLAMMASCLVFTASAEDSVAVTLQGPTTVAKDGTFQVKVRVTDTQNVVGGVQGMVEATGATVAQVEVNPDLKTWNNTEAVDTIYKLENNVVTFASLNKLTSDSYTTRVWFIITYNVEADVEDVAVALKGVKVSNKEAKAITTVAKSDLAIDVVDTATEPNVSLAKAGIDGTITKIEANDQAMHVDAKVANIDDTVTDIGVVFYPTALLEGKELTVETEGAIVANVNKEKDPEGFNKIISKKGFIGVLEFNFSTEENALKFLGILVTARVYYKVGDKVVYASNASDDAYISNGTVSKAALNTILDKAGAIENPTFGTVEKYTDASKGVNTGNENWAVNRGYVLEYCVKNLGYN